MIKFPEELIDQFIQINSDHSDNAWITGDACVQVVDEFKGIYKFASVILRELASATGGSYETYRDRERVCRKIPRGAREKYELSFHQFRGCLSAGASWENYAKWAMEYADTHNGKPASVDAIRSEVQGSFDDTPSWLKRFDRIKEIAEAIIIDDNAPAHVVDALCKLSKIEAHPPYP